MSRTQTTVVRLQGGLGNQMFQYAYGRALARLGREVLFDASSFADDELRDYELDVWKVHPKYLDPSELDRLPKRYGGRPVRSWLGGRRPYRHLRERPQGFRSDWLNPPSHAYLDGYWQDERFFATAADELRTAFLPAKPLSEATLATITQIEACESVAVHVRRTDYLKVSALQVCDSNYATRCTAELLVERPDATAFVFSDDLDWCRENLNLPCEAHYIGHTASNEAWQDLWMMSCCTHHVISNSSFSWWAAWLAERPGQIVYAPQPWSHDPKWHCEGVTPRRWRIRDGAQPARQAAA